MVAGTIFRLGEQKLVKKNNQDNQIQNNTLGLCNIFSKRYVRCIRGSGKKYASVDKIIKNKPIRKLKHAKSILESVEHFSQMSSKSILIILSYSVSKLARFLRHCVYTNCLTLK